MSVEGQFRHLLGLIAHELRTPLGAIVGYQELLTDGLMGPLPERAQDAVRRIGSSSSQMRHLIDGLTDLMLETDDSVLDLGVVEVKQAVAVAAESARTLAAGRGVKLTVQVAEVPATLVTDGMRLAAALDLGVGAAVRASPGGTLLLSFGSQDGALVARVEGTGLLAERDAPRTDGGAIQSAPALRLAMAARMLGLLGGELAIEGAAPSTLRMRVANAPDAAARPALPGEEPV